MQSANVAGLFKKSRGFEMMEIVLDFVIAMMLLDVNVRASRLMGKVDGGFGK